MSGRRTNARRVALTVHALLFLLAPQLAASIEQQRIELTPLLGFVTGGTFEDEITSQELELDDSDAIGIQLNVRADNQTTWEIQYARQKTQATTIGSPTIDVTIEKIEIGGTYEINPEPTRPYAAATIGVSRFKPESTTFRDDTYFSFSIGGGVKFFADRPIGLTIDARWIAAVVDEDTDIFCLSADGLTCLIQTEAGLASQFRVFVGFNARF